MDKFAPKAEAPSPKTVSREAQQWLESLVPDAGPQDLQAHRDMCAGVQRKLGGALLERHGVSMEESFMAEVPVRIFTPPNIPEKNRDAVLLNLHGGGFTVDAGSVTENVADRRFCPNASGGGSISLGAGACFPGCR